MVTRLRLGIKPPRRAIGAIAEEIKPSKRRRTAAALVLLIREKLQDETRNFVEIGKMLNEARDSPELAGRWLAWLAEHFDMSDRTARNYMLAAEFVDKHRLGSETVSHLSRRLLYKMARREPIDDNDPTLTVGDWTDAIIKQILAEAARKRVGVRACSRDRRRVVGPTT